MALLYIMAGVNHFLQPQMYLQIMPPWLPAHSLLVLLSGIAEVILGISLFFAATRRIGAWGIFILLVAVFPANVQMTIDYYTTEHPLLWLAIVRLLLQFLLIWWAYQYTGKKERVTF
jgi:uncharacterized membrane protein